MTVAYRAVPEGRNINMTEPLVEPVPEPEITPEETVLKSQYTADKDKLLSEIHKYKAQLREITTASQSQKEQLLRDNKQYEELASMYKTQLDQSTEHSKQLQDAIVNDKKFSAVREAAVKAGLRPEAIADLELVALDKVQVEKSDTGRVTVMGVDSLVDNIKLSRPHWFGSSKTSIAGSMPNVSSGGGLVTKEEIVKLSLDAKRSGDYTAYEQKMRQFQKQSKGV